MSHVSIELHQTLHARYLAHLLAARFTMFSPNCDLYGMCRMLSSLALYLETLCVSNAVIMVLRIDHRLQNVVPKSKKCDSYNRHFVGRVCVQ